MSRSLGIGASGNDYSQGSWIFLQHSLYETVRKNPASQIGLSPRRIVPTEAKIRELCTRLLAAHNDEDANRALQELRDTLHEYCERVRQEVVQEMEREYPFHKDEMAAD